MLAVGATETFCSKKLCENFYYSVTLLLKLFLIQKFVKNRNNVHSRRHFVQKSSA